VEAVAQQRVAEASSVAASSSGGRRRDVGWHFLASHLFTANLLRRTALFAISYSLLGLYALRFTAVCCGLWGGGLQLQGFILHEA
jgi:hypothetical protein